MYLRFFCCCCSSSFSAAAQVTGRALAYAPIGGSSACADLVAAAFENLSALVLSTAPQWGADPAIPELLKPCAPMTNERDLSTYQVTRTCVQKQNAACLFCCWVVFGFGCLVVSNIVLL